MSAVYSNPSVLCQQSFEICTMSAVYLDLLVCTMSAVYSDVYHVSSL